MRNFNFYDRPHHYAYEIEFTENELNSNETFCKNTSKLIYSRYSPLIYISPKGGRVDEPPVVVTQNIDPNVLKSLIGSPS